MGAPAAGGVAFLGSFDWGTHEPAFVFAVSNTNTPARNKAIWEAASHEVGHTFNLQHKVCIRCLHWGSVLQEVQPTAFLAGPVADDGPHLPQMWPMHTRRPSVVSISNSLFCLALPQGLNTSQRLELEYFEGACAAPTCCAKRVG